MSAIRFHLLAASALIFGATAAHADDYTDLLDILKAKGSLTQSEYTTLRAKHLHNMRAGGRHGGMSSGGAADVSAEEAQQAAVRAAASAEAARQTMMETQAEMKKTEDMMAEPDIVKAMPYKPGAGLTMKVGDVDLNVSGIVNAFYTFSSADSSTPQHVVAGGLTDASGFDSSSVRNGLLPGAIIVSASTTQDGIDLTAVFGAYPGINSSSVGALNANNGGNATALGTAGIDFRKTYITAGTAQFGTVKLGRDIGLFGQDAILNDQTLLGVGATGGNADPGNTSLGRIGYGYIYADFMPQITYISPIFAGFQGSVGIFQPLNAFDFAGDYTANCYTLFPCGGSLPYSGVSNEHSSPMFQGRLTYDYKADAWSAHAWGGFVAQSLDGIAQPNGGTKSKTGVGGEVGATVTVGPVGVTGYYYRGSGVGTTALFFDAIAPNGQLRDSEGGYLQGFWKPIPKLKLVGSYGWSSLYLADGEAAYDSYTYYNFPTNTYLTANPASGLVRRNESETAGAYYSWTNWLTLVGEYTHTDSKSHGPNSSTANSVSAGAILFY
jgi:hypothetical protein